MTTRNLTVAMLFAGVLSVPVWAQNVAEPRARRDRPATRRGEGAEEPRNRGMEEMGGRGMMVNQQMERLTKELNLTKEQQKKIQKLMTDHRDQMRDELQKRITENTPKFRELRTQLQEARTAGDREKVRKLESQIRELMGDDKADAARQKLINEIEAVLTAEQKTKFQKIKDDVFNPRPPLEDNPELLLRAVESLELPKDKADKIKGLVDEWRTKHPRLRPRNRDEKAEQEAKAAAAEVYKKVMAELTPEQQTKVKEWRPASTMMAWPRGEGQRQRQGPDEGRGEGRGQRRGAGRQGDAPTKNKPKE
ncbi:MAG: Spy/CpxP family protein refolding chaperone [Phycisphaerae bacterium]